MFHLFLCLQLFLKCHNVHILTRKSEKLLGPSSFRLGLILLCNIFEAMKLLNLDVLQVVFHYLRVGFSGQLQVHKFASAKVANFGMF